MTSKEQTTDKEILAIAAKLERDLEALASAHKSSEDQPKTKNNSSTSLLRLTKKVHNRLKRSLVALNKTRGKKTQVSIIVTVNGSLSRAAKCLLGLSKQLSDHPFEVIVVDANRDSMTASVVKTIPGIKYIKMSPESSLADMLNQGASTARGNKLIFVDSSAAVMGNWLNPLTEQLGKSEVGIVGSKIVTEGTTLNQAGGIIFSDGTITNYGKDSDGNDYEYNYVREVDFVSPYSLGITRQAFRATKGFDAQYSDPNYLACDLAMRVRRAGLKVVYDPRSVALLTTVPGEASPSDQQLFTEQWRAVLKKSHYQPGTDLLLAARSGNPKRILIVDSIIPEWDKDSGSLRMHNIIKSALKLGFAVTFYPQNLVASPGYTPELQLMGVEVVYGRLSIQHFYKDRTNMFDVIMLSRPLTAIWHIDLCKAFVPKAKILYDTVDLHFLRIGRQAELENNQTLRAEAENWRKLEFHLMDSADRTLVVSSDEQALLKKQKPNTKVDVLSNINPQLTQYDKKLGFMRRDGLLFIGTYGHTPNRDAALWFVNEILPLIRKQLPKVNITLLGSKPTPEIKALASRRIHIPGFVDVVEPYFYQSRVFICPVRFGAGVKGKLSQALACGLPVVSTTVGAEGMHLKDGESALIADSAENFAASVVKLYNDKALWEKTHRNIAAVHQKYFSEKAGLEALKNVVK